MPRSFVVREQRGDPARYGFRGLRMWLGSSGEMRKYFYGAYYRLYSAHHRESDYGTPQYRAPP